MSFSLDISKFAEKTKGNVRGVIRKTATDMFSQITYRTPVDTGRARGNWQVSFGSPLGDDTTREDKSGLKTEAPLKDKILAFEDLNGKVLWSWKAGMGDIWLSNNLPYINRLEYGTYGKGPGSTEKTGGSGYSIQAPSGMVRITVREFQNYVTGAVKENNK